jgi:hypothetical protein
VGPHARLRRVSWNPDDPAAVDRLARDLVLVVANKPTLAVLRNANTSSPHSRLCSNRKVGDLSRQAVRRIFFRGVAIEARSYLFG